MSASTSYDPSVQAAMLREAVDEYDEAAQAVRWPDSKTGRLRAAEARELVAEHRNIIAILEDVKVEAMSETEVAEFSTVVYETIEDLRERADRLRCVVSKVPGLRA